MRTKHTFEKVATAPGGSDKGLVFLKSSLLPNIVVRLLHLLLVAVPPLCIILILLIIILIAFIIFIILIILMLPGRPQHFCWWGPPCSGKHSAGPSLPHSWKESLYQLGYIFGFGYFWDLDVFWISIGYFRRALPFLLLEEEFILKKFLLASVKLFSSLF